MRALVVSVFLLLCVQPSSPTFAAELLAQRVAEAARDGRAQLAVLRVGPEQGLAHNAVRAILQDRLGFL